MNQKMTMFSGGLIIPLDIRTFKLTKSKVLKTESKNTSGELLGINMKRATLISTGSVHPYGSGSSLYLPAGVRHIPTSYGQSSNLSGFHLLAYTLTEPSLGHSIILSG